jgi:hypothetical protein
VGTRFLWVVYSAITATVISSSSVQDGGSVAHGRAGIEEFSPLEHPPAIAA